MTDTELKTSEEEVSKPSNLPLTLAAIALIASLIAIALHFSGKHTLSGAKEKAQQLESRLTDKFSESNASIDKLTSRQQALEKTVNQLKRQRYAEENQWQLIKASHLLQLASLSVHFEKDPKQSLFLLTQVDKLVSQPSQTDTMSFRQQLHQAILALRGIPQVDKVGLLSEIESMQEQIKSLPLKKDKAEEPTTTAEKPAKKTDGSWRKTLDNSLNKLSKLVVIRYRKDDNASLISVYDKGMTAQQVILSLDQAQWAIVQGQQDLFTHTIGNALKTIQAAYDGKSANVKALVSRLETLEKTSISPKLPSLTALNQSLAELLDNQTKGDKA